MRRSSGAFGPMSASSRTPCALMCRFGAEFDGGVGGVGVRPQAIADLRILHEQFLEGRRGFGLVDAKRRLEHRELDDENHGRQEHSAARRPRQEISAHEVRRILSTLTALPGSPRRLAL